MGRSFAWPLISPWMDLSAKETQVGERIVRQPFPYGITEDLPVIRPEPPLRGDCSAVQGLGGNIASVNERLSTGNGPPSEVQIPPF